MATEDAREAYRQRKQIVEPAFGIIKEQMGIRRFLLRGCENVRAEAATVALAFNLRTLYSIWRAMSSEKRRQIITVLKGLGQQVTLGTQSLNPHI
jgi:hypothetical protein